MPVPFLPEYPPDCLFPPYLEKKSSGRAVRALQIILCSLGHLGSGSVTGRFCADTERAVKDLQEDLGFTGDDRDGKFGPGTRGRLAQKRRIDVRGWLQLDPADKTIWFHNGVDQGVWPPIPLGHTPGCDILHEGPCAKLTASDKVAPPMPVINFEPCPGCAPHPAHSEECDGSPSDSAVDDCYCQKRTPDGVAPCRTGDGMPTMHDGDQFEGEPVPRDTTQDDHRPTSDEPIGN